MTPWNICANYIMFQCSGECSGLEPLKTLAFRAGGTLEHLFSLNTENKEIKGIKAYTNPINPLFPPLYKMNVPLFRCSALGAVILHKAEEAERIERKQH